MEDIQKLASSLRVLSADAVEKAQSGHPGMPLGMADVAAVLWHEYLKVDPNAPNWANRDRFVLSNGHGSMLLYALLHFTGFDVSMGDIKAFRQLNSKTPGHPEYGHTPGVETTTGPLGQGLANAVGMALVRSVFASKYDAKLFDHDTYVFVGDGCLMEGVSHETCSFAGTHQIDRLIVFWDNNGISIDGEVDGWFSENVPARFRAYGWTVIEDVDGHDSVAIRTAIDQAKKAKGPVLIDCHTHIAYGCPNKQDTAGAHGAPLGEKEIAALRKTLGWSHGPFEMPDNIYAQWGAVKARGQVAHEAWQNAWQTFEKTSPQKALHLHAMLTGTYADDLGSDWDAFCAAWLDQEKPMATRKTSQACLSKLNTMLPGYLMGGSADLTGSNGTLADGMQVLTKNQSGQYIHYGVREFGMFAMMNGMAAYGGMYPYGGTFLTFLDYGRNAVRLAAMMRLPVTYVLTHDTVALGEDGPTHQPIEHLDMIHTTPHLHSWRPCSGLETAKAWEMTLKLKAPVCMILSRQNIESFPHVPGHIQGIERGGYELWRSSDQPKVVLIASGSEVDLAMQTASLLKARIAVSVVSVPNLKLFLSQDMAYQKSVMGSHCYRVVIEAAYGLRWSDLTLDVGDLVSIREFGCSAPMKDVLKINGLTPEALLDRIVQKMPKALNHMQET